MSLKWKLILMIYKLTFLKSAKKEWDKLSVDAKKQFKNKLQERLLNPLVPKDSLIGMKDCYKIKLKSLGYRLVYKVLQEQIVVQVVAVGKRDKSLVYELANQRVN
jgi:mRNA interferase RelE/StbE